MVATADAAGYGIGYGRPDARAYADFKRLRCVLPAPVLAVLDAYLQGQASEPITTADIDTLAAAFDALDAYRRALAALEHHPQRALQTLGGAGLEVVVHELARDGAALARRGPGLRFSLAGTQIEYVVASRVNWFRLTADKAAESVTAERPLGPTAHALVVLAALAQVAAERPPPGSTRRHLWPSA